MSMEELTVKQKRFIEAYAGNATQAALSAGYSPKTAAFIGAENLKKPKIQQAIQAREHTRAHGAIADREALQGFWTSAMEDTEQAMRDRLKASELLGKSEGVFLERVDLSNKDGSMSPPPLDLGNLDPDQLLELTRAVFGIGQHG